MQSIIIKIALIFVAGTLFTSTASGELSLEEQNGKLMYPILDANTGKYTYDMTKGKKIIEHLSAQQKN